MPSLRVLIKPALVSLASQPGSQPGSQPVWYIRCCRTGVRHHYQLLQLPTTMHLMVSPDNTIISNTKLQFPKLKYFPNLNYFQILVSLAAAASAAPQIVPYEHVEIAAEPYIHEEIETEPYVHIEPELTPEALGIITRKKPAAAPVVVVPQFSLVVDDKRYYLEIE